ncbi:MAG: geranylgeranyl reductase family protein [Steroidobacteraceae bacterium]
MSAGAPEQTDDPRERIAGSPDVLVVGLGPAGSRAAAVAAADGWRVVGVERRSTIGAPVQCAELVCAALTIEGLDWSRVTAQGVGRMVTWVEDHEPESTAGFAGRMISRRLFDQQLAARAAACGARLVHGVSVTGVHADGSVRLSSGVTLRPRVIVGADGPRSQVGAAIGRVNRELVVARQVAVRLETTYEATDIFLRAAYRGGYGWLFPKDREANLGIGVDYAARSELKTLLAELESELRATGRIGAAAGPSLTGGLIPVGGRLVACGRLRSVPVALAGDAAGLTNPVTGAGIEAAVRSGELAGRAASGWLAGQQMALEDFEEELGDLYDGAYARAQRHRRETLRCASVSNLRRGWISSPEYWA